jgi:hypothetical protein
MTRPGVGQQSGPSSFGFSPGPGLTILPSLTLAQAVETMRVAAAAATRAALGGGAAAGGAARGGGFSAYRLGEAARMPEAYPGEPSLREMDAPLVGCVLALTAIRRSTKESTIRAFFVSYGGEGLAGYSFRRLDDHGATLKFATAGQAARALHAASVGLAKGGADPVGLSGMKVRYWGVGVAAYIAGGGAAGSGAAVPEPNPSFWRGGRGGGGGEGRLDDDGFPPFDESSYRQGGGGDVEWTDIPSRAKTGTRPAAAYSSRARDVDADAWDMAGGAAQEEEEEAAWPADQQEVPAPAPAAAAAPAPTDSVYVPAGASSSAGESGALLTWDD